MATTPGRSRGADDVELLAVLDGVLADPRQAPARRVTAMCTRVEVLARLSRPLQARSQVVEAVALLDALRLPRRHLLTAAHTALLDLAERAVWSAIDVAEQDLAQSLIAVAATMPLGDGERAVFRLARLALDCRGADVEALWREAGELAAYEWSDSPLAPDPARFVALARRVAGVAAMRRDLGGAPMIGIKDWRRAVDGVAVQVHALDEALLDGLGEADDAIWSIGIDGYGLCLYDAGRVVAILWATPHTGIVGADSLLDRVLDLHEGRSAAVTLVDGSGTRILRASTRLSIRDPGVA